MFVSDTSAHRIISYPSGRVIAGGNGAGAGIAQLLYPFGLIYDSISNSLLIPNYDIGTIVWWTVGDSQWSPLIGNASAPGGKGNTSLLLNRPVGITMDPMGNIYVADSDNHRVQFFSAGQSSGTTILGITGVSGLAANELDTPYWLN
jgi:DNA-binding beta-propeller fold protein YncE